jgi:cytochrome c oxidase assembly factor CtaG
VSASPVLVLAHGSGAGWTAWVTDPATWWVLAGAACYEVGRHRLASRHPRSPLIARSRVAAFWAGVATLLVALTPPVDRAAEDLFSAHMVQHLLLALVAPLAFVLARPLLVMAHVAGRPTRLALVSLGRRPFAWAARGSVALALVLISAHVVVFTVWHVPTLYDAAVEHDWIHLLEHASLFVTGLALWWVLVSVRWHARSGLAVLYLFLVGLPMGALGALLTLAPRPIYPVHEATTAEWDLTPLEDQQLAGGIMWVPGGTIYLAAASVLFVRWLRSGPAPGQEVVRWDA